MYIHYGFIPDVETCRSASPTSDIFHEMDLCNVFHTANLYPLHIIYIRPQQPQPDNTCPDNTYPT